MRLVYHKDYGDYSTTRVHVVGGNTLNTKLTPLPIFVSTLIFRMIVLQWQKVVPRVPLFIPGKTMNTNQFLHCVPSNVEFEKNNLLMCMAFILVPLTQYLFYHSLAQQQWKCSLRHMSSALKKRRSLQSAFPVLELPLQPIHKHIFEANLRNSIACCKK